MSQKYQLQGAAVRSHSTCGRRVDGGDQQSICWGIGGGGWKRTGAGRLRVAKLCRSL